MIKRLTKLFANAFLNDTRELCLDDEEVDHVVKNVKSSGCGLSDDELRKAVEAFERMEYEQKVEMVSKVVDKKLNIAQLCERYHITRMTINRWQQKGKLPAFRHDAGGKDYIFMSEADESVRKWNEEHPDIA